MEFPIKPDIIECIAYSIAILGSVIGLIIVLINL